MDFRSKDSQNFQSTKNGVENSCMKIFRLNFARDFMYDSISFSFQDRDQYIEVIWANIGENCVSQYSIQRPQNLVGRYDYASTMHYRFFQLNFRKYSKIFAWFQPHGMQQKRSTGDASQTGSN